MADGGHLRVQVALFCDENDALVEKLAQQQLSLKLFSCFTAAATVQLDLKDAWKEVRITNDEKNEEPDGAPESKSAKSGGKAVTPRPSSSSARGAKLNNAFQVHAAQIGAQTVYHTTLSISLAGRGEELYRTINAQPYLACCLFETAKADPSEDAAERAKRAEGSRPVQGFAIDVSPLLTAVGEVHATCVVGERMCGVRQIGFACGCTPSGEGVGPMISASVAPSYSPITLAIDKVTKLPAMSSDVGSIIATFELAGVRRVIFGQRVISPDRKCLAMLQTVVLAKFLDAAALKEDLASHSLDVEFHPRGAAVGVFSQEQLEEHAGPQASQKTDGQARSEDFLTNAIVDNIRAQRTLSPFASATVSLAPLLSTSSYVMSGYGARQPSPHVCSTLDCKASLLPSKAQFTKHGMKQLAMSATRIEPQHIPAFIEAGTAATVSGQYVRARESVELPAQAGRQIPQEEAEVCCMTGLYTRAVFVFRYDDDALLQKILTTLADVNSAALPNIQGTIRSYVLTEKEFEDAQDGRLDILCGFTVIDNDCRIVLVEGLADGGMQRLHRSVERSQANEIGSCLILANPDIRFSRRLYTQCGPDLKRIRLRQPLAALCERPDVYSSHRVDPACSSALTQLQQMKNANSLKQLQQYRLFPDFAAILKVESQYGQAVSKRDMDGVTRALQQQTPDAGSGVAFEPSTLHRQSMSTLQPNLSTSSISGDQRSTQSPRSRRISQYRNPGYEEHLRAQEQQPPKDFVGEQKKALAAVRAQYEAAKARREAESSTSDAPVFMYSTQALSSVEQEKARMRERLAKEKNATFTYSARFTSQTISLVDATRIKQDADLASRAKWKTPSGFVYPAPRTREELIAHPQKPDATRIDDLREPWEEPVVTKPPERFVPKPGQKPFDTVPSNMPVFGGYKPPRFAKEYSRDDIGNPRRLPRGRMVLEKSTDFFNSVHLVGTKLAQEQQEALQRDRELWKSKVVVDSLSFRVDGFQNRDRTLQLDRTADILHDPPMTRALKKVRNARLPSGKRVPLEPAPLGVLSAEPFVESTHFANSLRPTHPSRFTVTTTDGQPKDFVRYIRQSALDEQAH